MDRRRKGQPSGPRAAIPVSELAGLIGVLAEPVAVADGEGRFVLTNRPLEQAFGYEPGELAGQPVETIVPAELRAAHRSHRQHYARFPATRHMDARTRLVGLCKNGATIPVGITLSPLPATTGPLTLVVIQDATHPRPSAALTTAHTRRSQELFDRVVNRLTGIGLTLWHVTTPGTANPDLTHALQDLDATIADIRDHALTSHTR